MKIFFNDKSLDYDGIIKDNKKAYLFINILAIAIYLGGLTAVLEKSNKIYSLCNLGDKLRKSISV